MNDVIKETEVYHYGCIHRPIWVQAVIGLEPQVVSAKETELIGMFLVKHVIKQFHLQCLG